MGYFDTASIEWYRKFYPKLEKRIAELEAGLVAAKIDRKWVNMTDWTAHNAAIDALLSDKK